MVLASDMWNWSPVDSHTHFGRHSETYMKLEEILRKEEQGKINAMLIGAGWAKPSPIREWNRPPPHYSWEYVELAIILDNIRKPWHFIRKPWHLTVADYSAEICEEADAQRELIIDNHHLINEEEHKDFKKTLKRLEDVTRISGNHPVLSGMRISSWDSIYLARIPENLIRNISVMQADLTNAEEFQGGTYDLVTCHYVMGFVSREKHEDTKRTLSQLLAPRGILSIGFSIKQLNYYPELGEFPDLHKIDTIFERDTTIDYGFGGKNKEPYYAIFIYQKLPQPELANPS